MKLKQFAISLSFGDDPDGKFGFNFSIRETNETQDQADRVKGAVEEDAFEETEKRYHRSQPPRRTKRT